jgi:multicomponent Na+:H+ antiporter subunit G
VSGNGVVDVLSVGFLLVGAFVCLSGCIGLVRFPDVLSRMHAATKPQVLGLLCMLVALGLQEPTFGTLTTLALIGIFQTVTAPTAAHMVGRAAYRSDIVDKSRFARDELAEAVERASRDEGSA